MSLALIEQLNFEKTNAYRWKLSTRNSFQEIAISVPATGSGDC